MKEIIFKKEQSAESEQSTEIAERVETAQTAEGTENAENSEDAEKPEQPLEAEEPQKAKTSEQSDEPAKSDGDRASAAENADLMAATRLEADGSVSALVRIGADQRVYSAAELRRLLDKAFADGRNSALQQRLESETSIEEKPFDDSGFLAPRRSSVWDADN